MSEPTAQYRNGNGKYRQSAQPPALPEMFGKLPPQAVELEQVVLGAIMLDREALPVVIDILRAESYYKPAHGLIYSACLSLYGRGEPIDILTVTEELRRTGNLDSAGGSHYLAELTNRVASAANIEYHARIIAQKALQRQMIDLGQRIAREGYEDEADVFEQLYRLQQSAFDLGGMTGRGAEHLGRIGMAMVRGLMEAMQVPDGITGIPSGLIDLDRITGGFQNTDLIIIAGRPGAGKTGITLCAAINAAKRGKAVGFFSLEMGAGQLAGRAAAVETGIDSSRIRTGKITNDELRQIEKAVSGFNDLPVFIDDTPGVNVFELRAKARKLVMKHGVQLIIVDYLQLMTGPNEKGANREQEVSAIARGLKNLAKELNVPVIALSQLSRAVELRGGSKRPQLSDLRESGSLEQDSDLVAFIYRPEYYGIFEDENGNDLKGVAEFIIAKHRHGALDTVNLRFIAQTTRFTDFDAEPVSRPVTVDVIDYTIPASARPDLDSDPIPF